MNESSITPTLNTAPGSPRQGFGRRRLHNFGITMAVMGASFILYYLGLFGTVDGPLTPGNMGVALSSRGVTQRHVIHLLLLLLVGAVSWNWFFNWACLLIGRRMTCKGRPKGLDGLCGAPVMRASHVSRRTGRTVVEYVCPCGHRRTEAHFHPLKKGPLGNTVWIACLIFVVIAFLGT